MNIKVITVGKIKEAYLKKGIDTYLKQLNAANSIDMIALQDEMTPDNAGDKLNQQILEKEGNRILEKISDLDYVITLQIEGKQVATQQFARLLHSNSHRTLVIVIGGSLGLSEAVKKRSNKAISFSNMTFPHQLMQLILLEQLVRVL